MMIEYIVANIVGKYHCGNKELVTILETGSLLHPYEMLPEREVCVLRSSCF